MRSLSNLPPGVTDHDIEEAAGAFGDEPVQQADWIKEREARESAIRNQAFEIRYAVFGGDIEPRSYLGEQMSNLERLITKALLAKSEDGERAYEKILDELNFERAQWDKSENEYRAELALREQRIGDLKGLVANLTNGLVTLRKANEEVWERAIACLHDSFPVCDGEDLKEAIAKFEAARQSTREDEGK